MSSTNVTALSSGALESALRGTTEALATELAFPTPAAPVWSTAEWAVARAAATIHGIAPLLGSRLRWRGPESWQHFLAAERATEQRRHGRITELLRLIDEALCIAGLPAVALKGSALYEMRLYGPGERPMADVDVLVRPGDFERAARALESLGFEESCRDWKNRVFVRGGEESCPPREPGEHPVKIELHERIGERLPARIVDISRLVFPQQAQPGLNPYPSRAALIAHLLLHAAGSIVDRLLRLIQLHDIALLSSVATDEDWTEVVSSGERQRAPWWAFPPLALTARYYEGCIPHWVLCAARATCPAILSRISAPQRLSDVSLSFPWIAAFPGIAWNRSVAEALSYVGNRIAAGREATTLRTAASRSEPGLSAPERRWLAASQGRRILRWLLSRPARSLTMRAVRSAFDGSA